MELQGIQRLNCASDIDDCRELIVEAGSGIMSQDEFDNAIYDLTNFLHYVGDPSQEQRRSLGVWVLEDQASHSFQEGVYLLWSRTDQTLRVCKQQL